MKCIKICLRNKSWKDQVIKFMSLKLCKGITRSQAGYTDQNVFLMKEKNSSIFVMPYTCTEWILQTQSSRGVLREKMFWKYAANLHENTHAEVWFQ